MLGPIRALRLVAAAFVVSGGLIVASCGGGSVYSGPAAQPTATSAPVTQSIPTSGGALTLASSLAQVASLSFAAGAPAGVSLTATSSSTAPAGAPAISSVARSVTAVTSRSPEAAITGAVPFFYVTFSVSANLSSQFISAETVTLGTNPPSATYGVAFDDITSAPFTELGTAGPGTIANGIVTITNGNSANAPVLQAGHTYLIQFFYVPAASPTATPTAAPTGGSPTSTPTGSSPTSTPTATPTSGPTAVPAYTFSGASDSTSCGPMDPCTPPLSFQVGGATANLMFGTSQASTTIQLSGTAGTGLSQVTPTSPPFPLYTGTGTAQLYIAVASSANVSFAQTPAINYQFGTTPTYAGCGLYVYASSGSNVYSWNLVAPATGSTPVSGSSVNIPATTLTNGTVNLTTTPTYVTIVCQ